MTWNEIKTNWPTLVPSLMARFPELDEDRLIALSGARDELVAELAERSERDLAEAERVIEIWRDGPMPSDAYADPLHDDAAARDASRWVPEGEDPLADDQRFGDDDVPATPVGRNAS